MKKILFAIISVFMSSILYAQEAKLPKLKPLKDKDMIGALVPVEKKGMWGYALAADDGKKPKVVVKETFEEAHEFVDSVAIVKCNGKYGLLKRTGMFELDPEFDEFEDFKSGSAWARINEVHYKITSDAKFVCRWEKEADNTLTFSYKDIIFKMKPISAGQYEMGGEVKYRELDHDSPKHDVNITKGFYIGETEVTQSLWNAVMGDNPSHYKGDSKPVESISWDDCQNFMEKLEEIFDMSFRLPTEAEWEYAARGGENANIYSGSNDIEEVGWYASNCKETMDVKSKSPNKYGLYDMSGNVAEWCSDWYNSNYYIECPYNDPAGAALGKGRVVRGGEWKRPQYASRVFYRTSHDPKYKGSTIGLRLAK